jgi:hypothetical protein
MSMTEEEYNRHCEEVEKRLNEQASKELRETIITVSIFAITMIIFIIMFGIHCKKEYNHMMAQWNNGICTECSGEYEFYQAVGHRSYSTYVYKCNNCGKVLELDCIMKKENQHGRKLL